MNSERIYRYRRVFVRRPRDHTMHRLRLQRRVPGARNHHSARVRRGLLKRAPAFKRKCTPAMPQHAHLLCRCLAAGVTAQNRNPPLGQPGSASAPLFIRASVAARIRSLRSDSDPTTTGRCLLGGIANEIICNEFDGNRGVDWVGGGGGGQVDGFSRTCRARELLTVLCFGAVGGGSVNPNPPAPRGRRAKRLPLAGEGLRRNRRY